MLLLILLPQLIIGGQSMVKETMFPYDSLDPSTQYQFDVCGPQFFSLYVRDSNV